MGENHVELAGIDRDGLGARPEGADLGHGEQTAHVTVGVGHREDSVSRLLQALGQQAAAEGQYPHPWPDRKPGQCLGRQGIGLGHLFLGCRGAVENRLSTPSDKNGDSSRRFLKVRM